ncbi:MAG: hypothetical protein ACK55Z_14790, partial [bacterium]
QSACSCSSAIAHRTTLWPSSPAAIHMIDALGCGSWEGLSEENREMNHDESCPFDRERRFGEIENSKVIGIF